MARLNENTTKIDQPINCLFVSLENRSENIFIHDPIGDIGIPKYCIVFVTFFLKRQKIDVGHYHSNHEWY